MARPLGQPVIPMGANGNRQETTPVRVISRTVSLADPPVAEQSRPCKVIRLSPGPGGASKFASAKSLRILYLFCGPARKGDFKASAAALANKLKIEVHVDGKDLLQDPVTDLSDERSWECIFKNLDDDVYDCICMAPPCDSFGSLLSWPVSSGDAVGVLRDEEGPGR